MALILASWLAFPIGLSGTASFGCGCGTPPLDQAYAAAEVVFRGRVLAVEQRFVRVGWSWLRYLISGDSLDLDDVIDFGVTVRFLVAESWKGELTAEVSVLTGRDFRSCGIAFEPGEESLVFAERGPTGLLETSACQRTIPIERAAAELRFLTDVRSGAGSAGAKAGGQCFRAIEGRNDRSYLVLETDGRYRRLVAEGIDIQWDDEGHWTVDGQGVYTLRSRDNVRELSVGRLSVSPDLRRNLVLVGPLKEAVLAFLNDHPSRPSFTSQEVLDISVTGDVCASEHAFICHGGCGRRPVYGLIFPGNGRWDHQR